ncbi:hypothetical protein RM779_15820 [Streptomyces sp. DSM 41886]|uniref:Uncharacterized protein n=2 Tax=Streptomyces johnsoniae TaxID=3075532 RepID=A0ABU2S501_9ACTN|nr:hypothetical protein [Streptomyces sp. DSM 41886]
MRSNTLCRRRVGPARPQHRSALPPLSTENSNARTFLAQFHDKDRVIDGPDDGFFVDIS